MTQPPQSVAAVVQRLRTGDLAGARAAAEEGLRERPAEPALLELAGLVAAQMGDPAAAIPHFRRLLDVAPANRGARINLATALLASDDLDEAAAVAANDSEPRLLRIAAYAHQQRGRLSEAAQAYEAVLAAHPDDFESWNNLGNVRAARGDAAGAIHALQRAITLRPDLVRMYVNLSEVLAGGDRDRERQALMREAARRAPADPDVLSELGLAEAAARDYPAAERAFRESIRLSPAFIQSYLELGLLLENLNRVDELAALVEQAEARGVAENEFNLIKAWSLRRQGKFEDALPLAEATPASVNPIRSAQLRAEIYDRLGDAPRAFAAFEEMNAASLAAKPAPSGPTYRQKIEARARLITPERIAAWPPLDVDLSPPAPIFVVGFPRSGTTLLDTLLMNVPSLHVMEELPAFQHVETALGDEACLPDLKREEAQALRARYFEAVGQLSGPHEEQRIVDKHPLHMARMPAIHRLFPDAKIVLVERHPCDAVLSCFMSNFTLNHAMRSFVDLEEAARTYDAVFGCWTRSETAMPLNVHRVRYERMVEDLEAEMRPLLAFLDIAWDPKVLDNIGSAAKREHIRTASYSQVTEPIYRRSAGRWQRYSEEMIPVIPILAPWAKHMGYAI